MVFKSGRSIPSDTLHSVSHHKGSARPFSARKQVQSPHHSLVNPQPVRLPEMDHHDTRVILVTVDSQNLCLS
jgi:hypothetical protein